MTALYPKIILSGVRGNTEVKRVPSPFARGDALHMVRELFPDSWGAWASATESMSFRRPLSTLVNNASDAEARCSA
jgi:hypothetical protein